jgi:hypothetical protein
MFSRKNPHPGSPPAKNLTTGARYHYYEGTWNMLPDFAALTPKSSGTTDSLQLGRIPTGEENFGVVYDGYIRIPRDGVYRFYVWSDDGSRLILNKDTLVNNDGVHWPIELHGEIALKAGDHPFVLSYFQGTGGKALGLQYEGPGVPRQFVSPDQLFHE